MEAAHRAKLIGDTESPLDGHKLYARVKLAYALAVLNGHYSSVRPEDWELSGIVMDVSDATRKRAVDTLRQRSRKQAEDAGKQDRLRKAAAANADKAVERIADSILRYLEGSQGGMSKRGDGGIRHRLRSTDREFLDDALAQLVADGKVSVSDDGWVSPGQSQDTGT